MSFMVSIIPALGEGDRYSVKVKHSDGTISGGIVTGIQAALKEADRMVALQQAADEPNPTPGQVVRGGKRR